MKLKRWRLDNIAMTIGLTIIIAIGLGLTLQQLANAGLGLIGLPQGKDPFYDEARFYMALLPAKVAALVEALEAIPTQSSRRSLLPPRARKFRLTFSTGRFRTL